MAGEDETEEPDADSDRVHDDEVRQVSVTFQIEHVERVKNAGRLYALARVALDVDGIEMRLQGVRVVRQPTGLLAVEAPQFRQPGGEWVPAVTLPPELKQAIAQDILDIVDTLP